MTKKTKSSDRIAEEAAEKFAVKIDELINKFAILNSLVGTGTPFYVELMPSPKGTIEFFFKKYKTNHWDLNEKLFEFLKWNFEQLFQNKTIEWSEEVFEDFWSKSEFKVVDRKVDMCFKGTPKGYLWALERSTPPGCLCAYAEWCCKKIEDITPHENDHLEEHWGWWDHPELQG